MIPSTTLSPREKAFSLIAVVLLTLFIAVGYSRSSRESTSVLMASEPVAKVQDQGPPVALDYLDPQTSKPQSSCEDTMTRILKISADEQAKLSQIKPLKFLLCEIVK